MIEAEGFIRSIPKANFVGRLIGTQKVFEKEFADAWHSSNKLMVEDMNSWIKGVEGPAENVIRPAAAHIATTWETTKGGIKKIVKNVKPAFKEFAVKRLKEKDLGYIPGETPVMPQTAAAESNSNIIQFNQVNSKPIHLILIRS